MVQLVRSPAGEITVAFDEVEEQLERALPAGHPVLKEVNDLFERAGTALSDLEEALNDQAASWGPAKDTIQSLIDALEDWKRGVKDWHEVQKVVDDCKAFVEDPDHA